MEMLAAHDSALGLDVERVQPAALEDSPVSAAVGLEALVAPGLVAVERVGVLHDELADSQQSAAGPRLVAVLVGKWYQSCGSSLYDWSSRAW